MVQHPFEIFLVPTWLRVLTWSGTNITWVRFITQFGTQVKFRWSRDRNNRTARMHFPRPDIFLRWNSNLQQVDFGQCFPLNNIMGLVVLAVNDGFLHLHV